MKLKSQVEALKSVRKQALPQNRIIRPMKGGGYRRPRNTKWNDYD
jgi:hypothetical protein